VPLAPPPGPPIVVAVDRRPACRVERAAGGLQIRDVDAPPGLVARVLLRLGVSEGAAARAQARVPGEVGLAVEAALAVSVVAAADRALGLSLGQEGIAAVAGEEAGAGLAAAVKAALCGGVVGPTARGAGPLPVDPARVEECLLLVDAGSPVAELRVEGASERVGDALLTGRFEAVGAIWREEWAAVARAGLAPAGSEAARVAEVLLAAGAGVRPCGGGRLLAAWAPPGGRGPGAREAVVAAAKEAGLRLFAARVDLRGLEVEDGESPL
jgi:hypothetical protein